ncbi:MAG: hypothetical protein BroJett022_03900 [Actinomycetes bacterium]|nr:MAG: hypothetical protein BroJett022_03900 [Actinomycetes bacterium]
MRRTALLGAARALEAWGWERGWIGPDPYEALNGTRVPVPRSGRGRRVVIQAIKRAPIDLRRPLGIHPRRDSAAIAQVLSAYVRPGLLADERVRRARIGWCVDRLVELRTPFSSESSWGYHFDVETRFFFYPKTTPNTIATAFTGLALLDAHAAGVEGDTMGLAASAGRFFLDSVEQTPGRGGAFFGYFPGDRSPIHNASLLACRLLARLLAAGGAGGDERRMADAVEAGVGFALAHQRADGSWPYAEAAIGGWVDNFHTGYVLDALLDCVPVLSPRLRERALAAWRRGLDLYTKGLFDPDGAPRATMARRYPIDGQCVAQAIETYSRASAIEPGFLGAAWRAFDFAIRRMRRVDGTFVFQRHRLWTNRVPHVRWVQAPMLAAMGSLLDASVGGVEADRAR